MINIVLGIWHIFALDQKGILCRDEIGHYPRLMASSMHNFAPFILAARCPKFSYYIVFINRIRNADSQSRDGWSDVLDRNLMSSDYRVTLLTQHFGRFLGSRLVLHQISKTPKETVCANDFWISVQIFIMICSEGASAVHTHGIQFKNYLPHLQDVFISCG